MTLSKNDAMRAIQEGKKVAHRWFSSDEWMTYDAGYIVFEDGCQCTMHDFWICRQEEDWETGWRIVD